MGCNQSISSVQGSIKRPHWPGQSLQKKVSDSKPDQDKPIDSFLIATYHQNVFKAKCKEEKSLEDSVSSDKHKSSVLRQSNYKSLPPLPGARAGETEKKTFSNQGSKRQKMNLKLTLKFQGKTPSNKSDFNSLGFSDYVQHLEQKGTNSENRSVPRILHSRKFGIQDTVGPFNHSILNSSLRQSGGTLSCSKVTNSLNTSQRFGFRLYNSSNNKSANKNLTTYSKNVGDNALTPIFTPTPNRSCRFSLIGSSVKPGLAKSKFSFPTHSSSQKLSQPEGSDPRFAQNLPLAAGGYQSHKNSIFLRQQPSRQSSNPRETDSATCSASQKKSTFLFGNSRHIKNPIENESSGPKEQPSDKDHPSLNPRKLKGLRTFSVESKNSQEDFSI